MRFGLHANITGALCVLLGLATALTFSVTTLFWLRQAALLVAREKEQQIGLIVDAAAGQWLGPEAEQPFLPTLVGATVLGSGAVAGCATLGEGTPACSGADPAEQAALLFPATDLERRIAGADPGSYALLTERLKTVARQRDLDFSEQVRRTVRGLVAVRKCSLDAVAAQFSMNRRRLNRKLEREGTTYHRILQEALRTFAERLMLDTDMTLGRISAVLDYADASAFTRAFRNWHGCSPKEWRDRNLPRITEVSRSVKRA